MSGKHSMKRRSLCAALLGIGGGALVAGASAQENRPKVRAGKIAARPRPNLAFNNADFYGADGKLNEDAAKRAYEDLMRFHRYPATDHIRKNLFVSDLGLGKFTEVGLAAAVLINEKEGNYAALEVFLLPGQMIPEHWHVPEPDQKIGAKLESWYVRYGSTFAYGVGEPTNPIAVKIPDCQKEFVTVRHEKKLNPGDTAGVAKALDRHWQQAGPQGCILTEVATYHAGSAVRFADPKIKF